MFPIFFSPLRFQEHNFLKLWESFLNHSKNLFLSHFKKRSNRHHHVHCHHWSPLSPLQGCNIWDPARCSWRRVAEGWVCWEVENPSFSIDLCATPLKTLTACARTNRISYFRAIFAPHSEKFGHWSFSSWDQLNTGHCPSIFGPRTKFFGNLGNNPPKTRSHSGRGWLRGRAPAASRSVTSLH
jgi:hypothetical protein